ncbi:MAG: carbon storage regulator [Ignavibacteriae bacterium HGW-Ignavibacteriae-3]|nr:MAG: carbon storage regulator [Ignavibacteriae bacterium HGW-Ignavibacteriae-3]
MLVLSRKINEEIKLGPEISIKILSISENQVKIGIEAPKNVQIFRGEVFEKVKESTIEASRASTQKANDLLNYKIHKVE